MRTHLVALDDRRMGPASARYTIRINGHLGATLLSAFPAMASQRQGPETVLTGVLDQPGLYGVLAEIEMLGLDLLEVRRLEPHSESPERRDMATFNDTMIETFRANDGVLGGHFDGKTTLLLHTPGRKSGKQFVNPLVAAPYGDSYIICGSGGGAPQDPQWVANLEALDGPVTIELGTRTAQADHRVVRPGRDDDWDQLYGVWRAYWPDAAEYEKNTDRKFPVAVITVR